MRTHGAAPVSGITGRQDHRRGTQSLALPDLAAEINREHAAALDHAHSAVRRARHAGELLLRAKEQVQHGEWLPWLTTNCPSIKERTAQAYMRLARHCDPVKAAAVASLTLREALQELAKPKSATVAYLPAPAALHPHRAEPNDNIEKPARNQPREKRAADIRRLAGEGYRAEQIAAELGITAEHVRDLAREESITLPDATIGRSPKINARRVIEETVNGLSGYALGLQMINCALRAIEPSIAKEWAASITESWKPISRLRKQLREIAKGADAADAPLPVTERTV